MEFISPESGQSLQLVVMDEIRPLRGGVFLPDLASEIIQRYRFASPPAQLDPAQPVKFQTGVLHAGEITMPITSLELYTDGVIVNSLNTDDADMILDDFASWVAVRFKLRQPFTHLTRKYQSRIIVSLGESLDRFVSHFQIISRIVSKALGSDNELHVTRLTIGPHPPGQLPLVTTWNIEPRAGQPFVPNRYFSSAPLSTSAHIELLTQLEAAAR
jgi:hypothetical protein